MTPDQFRAWRKRLGLSQQAAAEALGINRRSVIRFEREGWPIPLAIELACAAIALGIRRYAAPAV